MGVNHWVNQRTNEIRAIDFMSLRAIGFVEMIHQNETVKRNLIPPFEVAKQVIF
jgi:hypothetical protein